MQITWNVKNKGTRNVGTMLRGNTVSGFNSPAVVVSKNFGLLSWI